MVFDPVFKHRAIPGNAYEGHIRDEVINDGVRHSDIMLDIEDLGFASYETLIES